MLKVVSVSSFTDQPVRVQPRVGARVQTARRGGFVHGTKIASTSGWKKIERIKVGDLIRTLNNGFKEVRRISSDQITISPDESRPENLPVQVPSGAGYNGRPLWLMPEQGVALDQGKLDPTSNGISVIPARLLSGAGRLRSRAPGRTFDVSSLYFDQDQVIFIEGGLQAFCSSGRIGLRSVTDQYHYPVLDDKDAAEWIDKIAISGDLSAMTNPLGALPAPISDEPIFPVRPPKGYRRPGRPGRPPMPTLFLKPEWMMITHQE